MVQKIDKLFKPNRNMMDILNEEYDDALKDKTFASLAVKTKLKRDVLIKYTSTLKTCAFELNNCKDCPGLFDCKNKLNGYVYLPKLVEGMLEFGYKPCKFLLKENKKNKYLNNVNAYNMPLFVKDASFKKIYKTDKNRYKTILWLNDFVNKYKEDNHQKGLFLSGNFGCGKTYLITALFNELAKDGVKSAIVFWPEFLRDLKTTFGFSNSNEFKLKFDSVKKASLLLIDDIGAESVSSWNRDEVLCPLLQYRMDNKLPTFFTSNLTLESLETHFQLTSKGDEIVKAGRIISRIKQLSLYEELISKNLRK